MSKKTALTFFIDELPERMKNYLQINIALAKQAEKEQIEEAFNEGGKQYIANIAGDTPPKAEDYYNKTFKSVFFLGILLFLYTGCSYKNGVGSKSLQETIGNREIYIYTIDSCEYIGELGGGDSRSDILTHKGNCKNRIHYKE
jgi:hypothetical protein